ncbi:hypothetical protein EV142_102182 [Flavobacterium circumlabens]|uniref:Uncharacterized protein n=1 Tax=Flavobacterium circumlabens TaxID=2133765 RepID=A0ABY2B1A2_9FLAO|nr:hypothetical protein EV142_102182 [Flavobacterium circumlabens]
MPKGIIMLLLCFKTLIKTLAKVIENEGTIFKYLLLFRKVKKIAASKHNYISY